MHCLPKTDCLVLYLLVSFITFFADVSTTFYNHLTIYVYLYTKNQSYYMKFSAYLALNKQDNY